VDVGELRLDEMRRLRRAHVPPRRRIEEARLLHPQRGGPARPRWPRTPKRLQQIIKNLLSNAFKFTHRGQVVLSIEAARSGWDPQNEELEPRASVIAFTVRDTGIGIPPDKQQIIFEAFQQADGSTAASTAARPGPRHQPRALAPAGRRDPPVERAGRRQRLHALPAGALHAAARAQGPADAASVASAAIRAARSTLQAGPMPRRWRWDGQAGPGARAPPAPDANEVGDDRESIVHGDSVLLIVENDAAFASVLLEAARERGFKGIVTSLGASALALAREFHPSAITLDIYLPDIQGWRVLDRLKSDIETRHIPVCVISTEDSREQAMQSGALHFVAKPLQSKEASTASSTASRRMLRGTSRTCSSCSPTPRS
jgi:CheY-like chemotaxis protein